MTDPAVPSVARMYDYFLGGKDHFAADRAAAEQMIAAMPEIARIARANRRFLVRAVRYLAEQGIDQFIDVGAGIPTSPNVHEVAREVRPGARVVYVDNDPVVMAYTRALRVGDGVLGVAADASDTAAVLQSPCVRELIDFDRPIAVLFIAVIHYLGDDARVRAVLEAYRDALPPGSWLAASVAGESTLDVENVARVTSTVGRSGSQVISRDRAHVRALLRDIDPVDPGVVPLTEWHATEPGLRSTMFAAVGPFR